MTRIPLIRLASSLPIGDCNRRILLGYVKNASTLLIGYTSGRIPVGDGATTELEVHLAPDHKSVSIIKKERDVSSGFGSDVPQVRETTLVHGLGLSDPTKLIQTLKKIIAADTTLKAYAKPKAFIWCRGSIYQTISVGLDLKAYTQLAEKLGL